MFTGFENVQSHAAPVANSTQLAALLEDFASDPTDLLDLAALRGVAFQSIVTDLLETRAGARDERSASVIKMGRFGTGGRIVGPPSPEPPPFVWVRLLPPPGARPTVRAGWLTAEAFGVIIGDARAAGRGSRLEVIVPLDSGTAAVERVRALCRTVTDDLVVIVQAASELNVRRAREGSGARTRESAPAPLSRGYRATWIAFAPVGARP